MWNRRRDFRPRIARMTRIFFSVTTVTIRDIRVGWGVYLPVVRSLHLLVDHHALDKIATVS